MLAGHFSTALIAKQKAPIGSLIFFLTVSQLPDLLWLVFHFLGLEHTEPTNLLDVSLSKLTVQMIYSHDVLPTIAWAGICYLLGLLIFKNQRVALLSATLIFLHALTDYIAGYPHNIFGVDSMEIGSGLYYSHPYLAVLFEFVFSLITLLWFFATEKKNNVQRSKSSRNWIIGIFTFNILFMLSIADLSTRELMAEMGVDFSAEPGFQTTIPILFIVYISYIYFINKYASVKTVNANSTYK